MQTDTQSYQSFNQNFIESIPHTNKSQIKLKMIDAFPVGPIRFNYVSPPNSHRILRPIQFQMQQRPILSSKQQKTPLKKQTTSQQFPTQTVNKLFNQQITKKDQQISKSKILNKSILAPITQHMNDADQQLSININKTVDNQNKEQATKSQNIKQNNHRRDTSGESLPESKSLAIQDEKNSLKYKLGDMIDRNSQSLRGSQDLQITESNPWKKHKINKSSSIPVQMLTSQQKKLYSPQKPGSVEPFPSILEKSQGNQNDKNNIQLSPKHDTEQSIFQQINQSKGGQSKQSSKNKDLHLYSKTNENFENKIQQRLVHQFIPKTYKIKVKKKDIKDLYKNEDQKNDG